MINKRFFLLTVILATGCLHGMQIDPAVNSTVDEIIALEAQEFNALLSSVTPVGNSFIRRQTTSTRTLIPAIVHQPYLLAAVLDRCPQSGLRGKVESMVMWHLVDDQEVPTESRVLALLQLLQSKRAAGQLYLPNPKLDIFEEKRSPGSRELSFTAHLKQNVNLSNFPDLAAFIAQYEADRNVYKRLNDEQFARDQMELAGYYSSM